MLMSRSKRLPNLAIRTMTLLVGALALMAIDAYGVKADDSHDVARLAGTLSINDKAHMSLTGGSGNTLLEEGNATGTLPGKAKVSLTLTIAAAAAATSSFTIYPSGGSIAGNGRIRTHLSTSGRYESFSGSLSVDHGTGRYAHAFGMGNIYGVLDRRHDNAEVQVIGTLRY